MDDDDVNAVENQAKRLHYNMRDHSCKSEVYIYMILLSFYLQLRVKKNMMPEILTNDTRAIASVGQGTAFLFQYK